MIRYVFRDSPLVVNNVDKADPQVIGEALEKLAESNQGQLTPEAVLQAAKNRKHKLHQYFEWDDSKAANAYRLQQARMLIRAVAIEGEDEEEPIQAFHSVTDKGGRSYRTHEEVLDNPRLQRLILEAAKRDLRNFRRRYSRLSGLFEPDISRTIDRLDSLTIDRLDPLTGDNGENNDHPAN